jgi:thiol-disulfide isomerase/thioredoxin
MIFTPMNFFKITSLAGILLFASCQSKSQNSTAQTTASTENIDKTQVTWNPSIDDALAQAKASGKLLFVECYSPTCPVCQSMEPFFKKTEVATKYNSSFINYKLDVGNDEQAARAIWCLVAQPHGEPEQRWQSEPSHGGHGQGVIP